MHYKPIQEGHMCNLICEKYLDLAASGSFYCDYTLFLYFITYLQQFYN
jgi:energy-converting hydrogenase Eha subunit C